MRFQDQFKMNGDIWTVQSVRNWDQKLVDRTNTLKVATTDPGNLHVYLSEDLHGDFLMTVFIHELGHCALWSYGLLEEIHRMTKPEYWVDMEEFICNILADYGYQVFKIAFRTMGYDAWKEIPKTFERYKEDQNGRFNFYR